jgi:hypothetical protein
MAFHLMDIGMADAGVLDVDQYVVFSHRSTLELPRDPLSGGIDGCIASGFYVFYCRACSCKQIHGTCQEQTAPCHSREIQELASGYLFIIGN